ncbi:MAG: NosD domain-containing protein [Nanoarchaeota archaeon]
MNKRGVSVIIVSVLLVLIAIVLIMILWTATGPMIKQVMRIGNESFQEEISVALSNPCSDGTLAGTCSNQKPLFCENGLLIDDCGTCGCDSGTCNLGTDACEVETGGAEEIVSCTRITESGNYILAKDILDTSGISPDSKGCIEIQEDDVSLDCQGFKIESNRYSGIYSSKKNTVITNCNIKMTNPKGTGGNGIMLENSEDSKILGNNVSISAGGIVLKSSKNNLLKKNRVSGSNFKAFYLEYSNDNTLEDNYASGGYHGYAFYGSDYNALIRNTASGNNIGLYATGSDITANPSKTGSDFNVYKDNTFSNNNYGMWNANSHNNNFTNNSANLNSVSGIYIIRSRNNNIIDNVANMNKGGGIALTGSSNNLIKSNTANNNLQYGIGITSSSSGNLIKSNTANNNFNSRKPTDPSYGIGVIRTNNNLVIDNTMTGNRFGLYLISANNTNITGNNASGALYGDDGWGLKCVDSIGNYGLNNKFNGTYECDDGWPLNIPKEREWCNGADINRDREVSAEDAIILSGYQTSGIECNYANFWCYDADINMDGIVNEVDMEIVRYELDRTDGTECAGSCEIREAYFTLDSSGAKRTDSFYVISSTSVHAVAIGKGCYGDYNINIKEDDFIFDDLVAEQTVTFDSSQTVSMEWYAYHDKEFWGDAEYFFDVNGVRSENMVYVKKNGGFADGEWCNGADVDRNGVVGSGDFIKMQDYIRRNVTGCNEFNNMCNYTDINHDGRVNLIDSGIVFANYDRSCSGTKRSYSYYEFCNDINCGNSGSLFDVSDSPIYFKVMGDAQTFSAMLYYPNYSDTPVSLNFENGLARVDFVGTGDYEIMFNVVNDKCSNFDDSIFEEEENYDIYSECFDNYASFEVVDTEAMIEELKYVGKVDSCTEINESGEYFLGNDVAGVAGNNGCNGADINNDGNVGISDYNIFSTNWLRDDCLEDNLWCEGADINNDGNVDISDYNIFSTNWLRDDCLEIPVGSCIHIISRGVTFDCRSFNVESPGGIPIISNQDDSEVIGCGDSWPICRLTASECCDTLSGVDISCQPQSYCSGVNTICIAGCDKSIVGGEGSCEFACNACPTETSTCFENETVMAGCVI